MCGCVPCTPAIEYGVVMEKVTFEPRATEMLEGMEHSADRRANSRLRPRAAAASACLRPE